MTSEPVWNASFLASISYAATTGTFTLLSFFILRPFPNELNSYLTNSFTDAYTPLPSKPYFSISLTAGPDSP